MGIQRNTASLVLLGVALFLGCGDSANGSPGGEPVLVPLADLPCQSVNEVGIWQSAPPPESAVGDCQWLYYAPHTTYVFDHPLGRVPSSVQPYVSFEPDGTASTLASGNEFLHLASTETTVTIRNGQNQLFWLRLVLY